MAAVLVCGGCGSTGSPSSAPASAAATGVVLATPVATARPSSSGAATAPTPSARLVVLPGEAWVVYQGGSGGPAKVRLVRPDGSDDHALAPDLGVGEQLHPDWSSDGLRLVFAADDSDGSRDIWTANVDGSSPLRIFDCAHPCAWADDPAWSPDGKTLLIQVIAKTGNGSDGVGRLVTIDLATGTTDVLLDTPPREYFFSPRWDLDGHRIAVQVDRFKTAAYDDEVVIAGTIGIVDLAAGEPAFAPLLPFDSRAGTPDWSPDGTRIAAVLPTSQEDPYGSADLWLVPVDGGNPTQISFFGKTGGWAIQPSWSRTNDTIVFVGEDVVRTHPNLAFIQPDGSGLERLDDALFRTHPRLRPVP